MMTPKSTSFKLHLAFRRPDPDINIVLIHGLTGSSDSTWGTPATWLQWMSDDCNANVYLVDYPSSIIASPAELTLIEIGKLLCDAIDQSELATRPIAFIVHSLGGLVAKMAITLSSKDSGSLARATKYVCFIATPHKGSFFAAAAETILGFTSRIVSQLRWSDELDELTRLYRDFSARSGIETSAFYEKGSARVPVIVTSTSANPEVVGCSPLAITADHFGICKINTRDDTVFSHTRKRINIVSKKSRADFLRVSTFSFSTGLASFEPKTQILALDKHKVSAKVSVTKWREDMKAYPAYMLSQVKKITFHIEGNNCALRASGSENPHEPIYSHTTAVDNSKGLRTDYDLDLIASPFNHATFDAFVLVDDGGISFRLKVPSLPKQAQGLVDAVSSVLLEKEFQAREMARLQSKQLQGKNILNHAQFERKVL